MAKKAWFQTRSNTVANSEAKASKANEATWRPKPNQTKQELQTTAAEAMPAPQILEKVVVEPQSNGVSIVTEARANEAKEVTKTKGNETEEVLETKAEESEASANHSRNAPILEVEQKSAVEKKIDAVVTAHVETKGSEAKEVTKVDSALESTADKIKNMVASNFHDLKTKAEQTKNVLKLKGHETGDMLKVKAGETKDRAVIVVHDAKAKAHVTMDSAMVTLHEPHFQTCTIATAGGAITLGVVGGTFGLASGVVVGSLAGMVPALLTFGLSVPAGGAIGGACGLGAGTLLGVASGGIGGFTIYKYRIEIKDGIVSVKVYAPDVLAGAKDRLVMVSSTAKARIETQVCKVQAAVSDSASNSKKVDLAKAKASEAFNFATHTRKGVTSSSAVAGAVVGGTSMGAFGTVAGAALGVVPAIFTFGLSIPAGAMIGLCVGTTVGGSAGAAGGGLAGYAGFTHREAISESIQSSCIKVSNTAEQLKTRTSTVAAKAEQSLQSMIGGSTGGS